MNTFKDKLVNISYKYKSFKIIAYICIVTITITITTIILPIKNLIMNNNLQNELEKAQSEIALLKKEVIRLSDSCNRSVSRVWIWLSVFFFFIALLMGSIALDYKDRADSNVANKEVNLSNEISATDFLN